MVVRDKLPAEQLDEVEWKLIEELDSVQSGYNSLPGRIKTGNFNGVKLSPLVNKAIRQLHSEHGMSKQQVIQLSLQIAEFLIDNGATTIKAAYADGKDKELLLPGLVRK